MILGCRCTQSANRTTCGRFILFIWLYFKLFLFLLVTMLVIASVVPYVIVVAMPRWQWVLVAGCTVICWWLYLKYLPMLTNKHSGSWVFDESLVQVSALYVVPAMISRLLTLRLNYGLGITVFIHVLGYLAIPAFSHASGLNLLKCRIQAFQLHTGVGLK